MPNLLLNSILHSASPKRFPNITQNPIKLTRRLLARSFTIVGHWIMKAAVLGDCLLLLPRPSLHRAFSSSNTRKGSRDTRLEVRSFSFLKQLGLSKPAWLPSFSKVNVSQAFSLKDLESCCFALLSSSSDTVHIRSSQRTRDLTCNSWSCLTTPHWSPKQSYRCSDGTLHKPVQASILGFPQLELF